MFMCCKEMLQHCLRNDFSDAAGLRYDEVRETVKGRYTDLNSRCSFRFSTYMRREQL